MNKSEALGKLLGLKHACEDELRIKTDEFNASGYGLRATEEFAKASVTLMAYRDAYETAIEAIMACEDGKDDE